MDYIFGSSWSSQIFSIVVVDCCEWFWVVVGCLWTLFGSLWVAVDFFLDHCGSLWIVVDFFGSFWILPDCCGLFLVFESMKISSLPDSHRILEIITNIITNLKHIFLTQRSHQWKIYFTTTIAPSTAYKSFKIDLSVTSADV